MNSFEQDIKNCVQVLSAGGIILYPTDTVWGLGCNALDEKAIDNVFILKKRPANKSFIVLLAEAKDIFQYVASPHPDIVDMLEGFDRPTTVIYDSPLGFPDNLPAEDGSIAIRVTRDPFCKALIKRFRSPIVSTSANLSGQPTPSLFADIIAEIKKGADYVVEYRQEDTVVLPSSRIVRIKEDGGLEVIRG